MARKRSEGLFDLLAELPWWVSVVMGGVVYVDLKYLLPSFTYTGLLAKGIVAGGQQNASFFAALFLLPAAISAFKQFHRKRLFDTQTGLDSVRAMHWQDFELLIGEAFRRQGYAVEERGGAAPDGGIDLVLRKNGGTTLVQCKHWKAHQVGVRELREFFGVIAAEKGAGGLFVTSGEFTAEAKAFAEDKPIGLINGEALEELLPPVQANSDLYQLWKAAKPNTPKCPKCGSPMIQKVAKRGAHAGAAFWGCTRYPLCRGIVSI